MSNLTVAPRPSPLALFFLTFYFSLLLLTACTPADNSWQRIQDSGFLVVGLDPTFPPFENADTGDLHGLDVDLAYALGEELGVAIEFRYFGYDGLYDALGTGQVDVLISALVIEQNKMRDFAYSDPYFNAGQFLVTHENQAEQLNEVADLTGRTVAVEIGSEGHVQATQWARQVRDLTIRPLPTAEDALWVVLQEEVDTAVVDHVTARLYRQNAPQLQLSPDPLTAEPYAIVVRADDKTLLDQLNQALAKLLITNQLTSIHQRWLD